MISDLQHADSRALHEPFVRCLVENGPHATFKWLTKVLATQSPSLRSSNSFLVAYTGCLEGIGWLEASAASPVTEHWGNAAALLGTPWPRVLRWLHADGSRRLMALDALIACRAPAPNMAPLAQIAAPVLTEPPSQSEFQTVMENILRSQTSPRVRKAVESILALADEILTRRERGVAVADLPRLYVEPAIFPGADSILALHDEVLSHMRTKMQNLLNQVPSDES